MPSTISTDVIFDNVLSLVDAKRHLRISHSEMDEEIKQCVRGAVDYCERFTGRTLRASVARVDYFSSWEKLFCAPFSWLPVISLDAIKYYDSAEAQQTLASSNYRLVSSTDSQPVLEVDDDATLPEIDTRADAVQREYTTGYASASDIPPVALDAIKAKLAGNWGDGSPQQLMQWHELADRLLSSIDQGGYR